MRLNLWSQADGEIRETCFKMRFHIGRLLNLQFLLYLDSQHYLNVYFSCVVQFTSKYYTDEARQHNSFEKTEREVLYSYIVQSLDLVFYQFQMNSLKFERFAGIYAQCKTGFLSWFKCRWKNQVSSLFQLAPMTHL